MIMIINYARGQWGLNTGDLDKKSGILWFFLKSALQSNGQM